MAMSANPGRPYQGEPPADAAAAEAPPGAEGGGEILPCGRALDELWERWTDDPAAAERDPHLAHCPHCTAAVEELRQLDAFVRTELERDDRERARVLPADTGRITERVMDIVRTELRPGPSVPLGEPEEDHWVTETVAARTFRAAAEREPGVSAGSCRVVPAEGPERRFALPGSRLPRGPVRVRLSIVVPLRPGVPMPRIADAVRHRVAAAAERELGMEVAAVDVAVVDVAVVPLPDDPPDGDGPVSAEGRYESEGGR